MSANNLYESHMDMKTEELKIGEIAPEFKSESTIGELSLELFKDKNIVLYFYPKDMTPGCTLEAKEFSAIYPKFKELDTEIIGVSKDSLSFHNRFCEQENIPYPLLSDTEGKVCDMYGAFKNKSMFGRTFVGVNRMTFLIDKNRKIFKIWKNVKPRGHAKVVLNAINIVNLMSNKSKIGLSF